MMCSSKFTFSRLFHRFSFDVHSTESLPMFTRAALVCLYCWQEVSPHVLNLQLELQMRMVPSDAWVFTHNHNRLRLHVSIVKRPSIQGKDKPFFIFSLSAQRLSYIHDWNIFNSLNMLCPLCRLPFASQMISDSGAASLIKSWIKSGYLKRRVPDSGLDLVNRIYEPDRRKRLPIASIRQHPYLNQPIRSNALSHAAELSVQKCAAMCSLLPLSPTP